MGKSEGFAKAESNKAVAVSNPQEVSFAEVITATQKNACFWIYFKIMDLFFMADAILIATAEYL